MEEPTPFPGAHSVNEPWSALSLEDISAAVVRMGEPAYRAGQLYDALHRQGAWEWSDVTSWPVSLREGAAGERPLRSLGVSVYLRSSVDGTRKVLFETAGGHHVETVLMESKGSSGKRFTVCVSSQVGCPAACSFCASGIGGLVRNLTKAEITDQVAWFVREARQEKRRLDNIVYMGMGEPFLNYRRVMESIAHLRDHRGVGLGARRITVSTVGIVPGIRRFMEEAGEVNLAISLHAPNDELRSRLVPYNDRFPLASILEAAREYTNATGRRVSFEYVLLAGTNDDPALASQLVRLVRPFGPLAHVNLIPWNPFGEVGFGRAAAPSVDAFAETLRRGGANVTVRYSKGLDIDAACGQLRDRALTQALAS